MTEPKYAPLPLSPVEDLLAGGSEDIDNWQYVNKNINEWKVLPKTMAERLHVSRQTIHRWKKGGIPYWTADQVAISLGLHPLLIWPDFHNQEEPHEDDGIHEWGRSEVDHPFSKSQ